MIRIAALLLCLSLHAQFCRAQTEESDVALSWQKAEVHVPGNFFAKTPDSVEVEKKMPVILFMHGCSGIENSERGWIGFLKAQGFIVVLPDSFARKRPKSCNPATLAGNLFPEVLSFRLEEVAYALAKLKTGSFVDTRNIFLMGHSEGGRTTAAVDLKDFRAAIISGSTCYPSINLPKDLPLLAIDFENDPWRQGYFAGKHCSDQFYGRANSRQLTMRGTGHNSFFPEAQEAVIKFLRENIVQ